MSSSIISSLNQRIFFTPVNKNQNLSKDKKIKNLALIALLQKSVPSKKIEDIGLILKYLDSHKLKAYLLSAFVISYLMALVYKMTHSKVFKKQILSIATDAKLLSELNVTINQTLKSQFFRIDLSNEENFLDFIYNLKSNNENDLIVYVFTILYRNTNFLPKIIKAPSCEMIFIQSLLNDKKNRIHHLEKLYCLGIFPLEELQHDEVVTLISQIYLNKSCNPALSDSQLRINFISSLANRLFTSTNRVVNFLEPFELFIRALGIIRYHEEINELAQIFIKGCLIPFSIKTAEIVQKESLGIKNIKNNSIFLVKVLKILKDLPAQINANLPEILNNLLMKEIQTSSFLDSSNKFLLCLYVLNKRTCTEEELLSLFSLVPKDKKSLFFFALHTNDESIHFKEDLKEKFLDSLDRSVFLNGKDISQENLSCLTSIAYELNAFDFMRFFPCCSLYYFFDERSIPMKTLYLNKRG